MTVKSTAHMQGSKSKFLEPDTDKLQNDLTSCLLSHITKTLHKLLHTFYGNPADRQTCLTTVIKT